MRLIRREGQRERRGVGGKGSEETFRVRKRNLPPPFSLPLSRAAHKNLADEGRERVSLRCLLPRVTSEIDLRKVARKAETRTDLII